MVEHQRRYTNGTLNIIQDKRISEGRGIFELHEHAPQSSSRSWPCTRTRDGSTWSLRSHHRRTGKQDRTTIMDISGGGALFRDRARTPSDIVRGGNRVVVGACGRAVCAECEGALESRRWQQLSGLVDRARGLQGIDHWTGTNSTSSASTKYPVA